jgi:hypothetical protein
VCFVVVRVAAGAPEINIEHVWCNYLLVLVLPVLLLQVGQPNQKPSDQANQV